MAQIHVPSLYTFKAAEQRVTLLSREVAKFRRDLEKVKEQLEVSQASAAFVLDGMFFVK